MFIAVYMLTEPVTLPKRTLAKIMYAMVAGILTMLFRYYGAVLYSAVFALLLTNAFSPPQLQILNIVVFQDIPTNASLYLLS